MPMAAQLTRAEAYIDAAEATRDRAEEDAISPTDYAAS